MVQKIQNLEELIRDSIGGTVVEQTVTSLLPPGENYGSIVCKVDFKVKKHDKEESYHAVAKCTPLNKVTQEIFQTQLTFRTEIGWYKTVIPAMQQFLKERRVPECDYFQPFFGARISLDPESDIVDANGAIVTQNLKYLGYDNVDRHVGFDLKTTKSVIRDLASFHAIPLAIKIENPDLYDKKIKPNLTGIEMPDEVNLDQRTAILEAFEDIPECNTILERIKKNINRHKSFNNQLPREPWATVSHNDFWINNIMIKDGDDPKVMILDLQVPTYGSPAADLVFFLLTSVMPDVFNVYFYDLIKYYYENFTGTLKRLGVIQEFPYEELLQEIDLEANGGQIFHALGHSYIIFRDKGITALDSANAEDKGRQKIPVNDRQKQRFKWIAFEAAKRNWI